MSKNKNIKSKIKKEVDFEKEIVSKITSGKIVMKPKFYFILGSVFSIAGLTALGIISAFSINLMLFLLRKHGPMAQWKLVAMIESFPLWIPLLAILGIATGVWLLKKYDFSYKKNYLVIFIGFIISIIIAGFLIDQLGLNNIWSRKGLMKKFYQKIENQESPMPNNYGRGIMQNDKQNGYNRNRFFIK